MSKIKALVLSILFAALAVTFYMSHNTPFLYMAIVATVLFFIIWNTKRNRDYKIVRQARLEHQQTTQVTHPQDKTNNGSRRLLVPPSLED